MNPIEETYAPCELFCYAALADKFDNTIYSDATGKFPVPSYHGNRYVMVIYVYEANAILVSPTVNRKKEKMLQPSKISTTICKSKFLHLKCMF